MLSARTHWRARAPLTMSAYLVLARKYRPRTFSEVIGQEVVTRILSGALAEGRLGHAYLFAGPRGTGKTTMARILAKGLNCESGPTATPCGTCELCVSADEGSSLDIIELDAASHTGVDTIRELRDEVAYAPMRGRTKVYIIDEVHMLSKGAFNALLKTLEEPPPHVVFLFATTEPHKVLDTILSRCQVLRLDPLSEVQIAGRLTDVFEKEGVKAESGVVEALAREAKGGMRDALSLADKLLALGGDEPSLEDLRRLAGDGGGEALLLILGHIEAHDRAGLLQALAGFGGSEGELVGGLLAELRRSVVLARCGLDAPWIQGSPEERQAALERAQRLGADRIELWMEELLRLRERLRLFPGQERIAIEIALLGLARPEASVPTAALVERLLALEARLGQGHPEQAAAPAPEPPARIPASSKPVASPPPARAATSKPSDAQGSPSPAPTPTSATEAPRRPLGPTELWSAYLAELVQGHGSLADLLERQGRLTGEAGRYELLIRKPGDAGQRLLGDRRNRSALQRVFTRVAGDGELTITVDDGSSTPDVSKSRKAGPGAEPSPQESSQTLVPQAPPRAAERAEPKTEGPAPRRGKDTFTQDVADLFGGVIEDLS